MSAASSGRLQMTASRAMAKAVIVAEAHPFVVVFGIGLVLRLWAVASLNDAVNDQGGDALRYLSIARDVLEGRPYGISSRDYTRVPLYQFFLAVHLWLFNGHLIVIAITQAVLGSLTAYVLALTAREMPVGRWWWPTGLVWATYPPAILNTVVLFPQTLQVFWLALAFWLLLSGVRRGSLLRCTGAAVCWGFASLTRSGPLLFLPIFAVGPLLLWNLRTRRWSWAVRVSIAMFVFGMASVLWWTARDFTKTYRLEYLLLNGHERNAAALMLRPIEPAHARLSKTLRLILEEIRLPPIVPSLFRVSIISQFDPRQLQYEQRHAAMAEAVGTIQRERRRLTLKIEQALRAPDGCVQLACTGPPNGYWAALRANVASDPLQTAMLALGRPCAFLKVVMYFQHYALLVAFIPAMAVLLRSIPGVAVMFVLYVAFTVAGIVFASNYSETVAAVPRYAFALMPVVVFVTGVVPFLASRAVEQPAVP